jgi:SAM-dependent methyltransferase
MSSYIFEGHAEDREYQHLRMIESANDPATIALLQRTGIQPGWTCLELGPGAGSILQWLGAQVGANGRVMGIDKKTTYLQDFSIPPYDIREGNILDVSINHPLDLVHARYVLIHNHQDMDILGKIHHLSKPGSMAVFEEPDFTSAKLLNDRPDNPHARVNSAMCHMFVDLGLDPGYALRLPQKLQSCGFEIIETHSTMHLCEGNSPIANVMAESALALRHRYCETGQCSEQDIHHYVQNAHTQGFWTVYHSTVSVIAKLPT